MVGVAAGVSNAPSTLSEGNDEPRSRRSSDRARVFLGSVKGLKKLVILALRFMVVGARWWWDVNTRQLKLWRDAWAVDAPQRTRGRT